MSKKAWVVYCQPEESRLDVAQRLILEVHDSLVESVPRATLARLERIAQELEEIECSL
ncbi:MAG TPA: hypothetical protein VKH18_07255 [Terriglobales bacterium]|nr:hypothetical protein [Terriglobales bacterium]